MRAVRETIEQMLNRARDLKGEDAQKAYMEILRRDPVHFAALNELAILAYDRGHRSAARTLYEQAVLGHPQNPFARVNLANLLYEAGEADSARTHFAAALALDADLAEAHQGLARILGDNGDSKAADEHWRRSFHGQAIVTRRCRGTPPGVALLLLVSARGGNIPMLPLLDERVFAVTALYAEYYNPALPLPHYDLLFNAIGDADLCPDALEIAARIVGRGKAINPPDAVRRTGRGENARRLAQVPGVVAPVIRTIARAQPPDLEFPLLLRAPGFHTGQHFVRVEGPDELSSAIAALPGAELLAIQYLDARGADGQARKYRVMIIDGQLYPVHLAISPDWKVHYFTAAMTDAARAEEKHFLENMEAVLGRRALAALHGIGKALGLDYMGVDFALDPGGALLLFEANATMVLNPPDADPIWNYRRAPIARALDAARRMVLDRAQRC